MSRLYSINGQQFSLLAIVDQRNPDDEELDSLADLNVGETFKMGDGVEVKREE